MPVAKKPARKRKIQAHDVEVGSRTLDAVMADLAEVAKECAVRSARAEEIAAEAQAIAAEAQAIAAEAQAIAAEAAKRSARAEEQAQVALTTIGSLLQDLHLLAGRTDGRLTALENAAAE